ncbi:hypothetical protein [Lewinella sp. W8]|uniref:hypothetical protein n=1 Tax=Lewinella sp. W8 TaxID=2528208 RepID=UPI00106796D0|nr:hypothetical protein [Lewinella sp. W8]MTB53040.1 hypothetical protein [Lewinella sp. W8]
MSVPEKTDGSNIRLRGRNVTRRSYTLTAEVIDVTDDNYELAHRFQNGLNGFRFWYATISGRMVGGPYGIAPSSTDADLPLSSDAGGVEKIDFILRWRAEGDPYRGNEVEASLASKIIGADGGSSVGDGPTGLEDVLGYQTSGMAYVFGADENNIWGRP